jgi:hypothetical protein
LYHAVAEHLATFLANRQVQGRPVPFFIVRDFRAFLDCGVPAHGFLRVHCYHFDTPQAILGREKLKSPPKPGLPAPGHALPPPEMLT